MGKKEKTLGRSLVKGRFKKKNINSSLLHTAELDDGQDWNRINFQSITEQSNIDDFLATAELAGTEFQAERLNIKFVSPSTAGVLSKSEKLTIQKAQEEHKSLLKIPRRPYWDFSSQPEELAQHERESFLEWRHKLNELQNIEGITLTPFEKNLELWRQLWRVIERSDIVVQIVDARNPLLFHCEDLDKYVLEISQDKQNLLLVNKSDFLIESQRKRWREYFQGSGINAIFFSAIADNDCQSDVSAYDSAFQDKICDDLNDSIEDNIEKCREDLQNLCAAADDLHTLKSDNLSLAEKGLDDNLLNSLNSENLCLDASNDSLFPFETERVLNRHELVQVLESYYKKKNYKKFVTVGLVGYPNVGKSSTINSILKEKKVSVSATPGHTKHFQTHFVTETLLLCDCPGLVFPAFVSTKEEMIISGILPIDQMTDHVPPVNLVCSLIPRHILECTYRISILKPRDGEDPDRFPTSEELLSAYGYMKSFMSHGGIPNHPKCARYVLKDYLIGKLLYCHAPPGIEQLTYHNFKAASQDEKETVRHITPQERKLFGSTSDTSNVDKEFFARKWSYAHIKGSALAGTNLSGIAGTGVSGKPWKDHKHKRNTRQKLRKKFANLDE